jgi:hypothetical protein
MVRGLDVSQHFDRIDGASPNHLYEFGNVATMVILPIFTVGFLFIAVPIGKVAAVVGYSGTSSVEYRRCPARQLPSFTTFPFSWVRLVEFVRNHPS